MSTPPDDEAEPKTALRAASRFARRAGAVGLLVAIAACSRGDDAANQPADVVLSACRLKGVEIELRCATIDVPENRDAPAGRRIPIRFAVIPALARQPEPDPVFVIAGGPGQAATDVAGAVYPLFAKLNRDRDIVLVDQRGTGGSNRLSCGAEGGGGRLADAFEANEVDRRLAACATRLAKQADLTQYGTPIAVRDLDEIRAHLGYRRINLWGASYGTRVALEYARQFPDRLRTMTLDGVAPAWQKLPLSFGVDTHAAVTGLVADCAKDKACATRYPSLATDIAALFARLDAGPLAIEVVHPVTGRREPVRLTPIGLASLLRTPLYVGLTASLVPAAVEKASKGDWSSLAALSVTVGGSLEEDIALGMHLSIVCSEDFQAITAADLDAARAEAAKSVVDGRPDPFALLYQVQYQRLCAKWPMHPLVDAYYAPLTGRPGAAVPTLLLSGGIDPATPPNHATEVEGTLTRVRHLVAPHVGHGLSMQGCAPRLVERFVKSADPTSIDSQCLADIPRPSFYIPLVEAARSGEGAAVP